MIFFLYKKANNFVHLPEKIRQTQISDCCLWQVYVYIILYQQCQHFQRFQNPNLRFHGISDILYHLISTYLPSKSHGKSPPRNPQKLPTSFPKQRAIHGSPTSGLPRQFLCVTRRSSPVAASWVKGPKFHGFPGKRPSKSLVFRKNHDFKETSPIELLVVLDVPFPIFV